jgi:hypothetical protein
VIFVIQDVDERGQKWVEVLIHMIMIRMQATDGKRANAHRA